MTPLLRDGLAQTARARVGKHGEAAALQPGRGRRGDDLPDALVKGVRHVQLWPAEVPHLQHSHSARTLEATAETVAAVAAKPPGAVACDRRHCG